MDDYNKISVNSIMYGACTKQEVLRELVYKTYGNSSIENATMLNVFVDLNSILHALYSEHNRIIFDNITDISSGVINMCAHYRSFFRSKLSVDTRFFLINSLNTCDINEKFIAGYNAEFKKKVGITQTKSMIDNNMSLLKVLCPYLPAIYYVDSAQNFEVAVIIAHIIETLNDPNPNLIISKDMFPIQLVTDYRWTSYLCPVKYRGQDMSWMLPINEKVGFREEFWSRISINRKYSFELMNQISPINYSLFTSMTKVPERFIKGIVAPSAARDLIKQLVGSEDVKIQISQIMNDPDIASRYPVELIKSRYNAIDIGSILPYYKSSPESKQLKFIDLDDPATVNRIDSKYYANNPLDLQRL